MQPIQATTTTKTVKMMEMMEMMSESKSNDFDIRRISVAAVSSHRQIHVE